jgi:hypothetical protein
MALWTTRQPSSPGSKPLSIASSSSLCPKEGPALACYLERLQRVNDKLLIKSSEAERPLPRPTTTTSTAFARRCTGSGAELPLQGLEGGGDLEVQTHTAALRHQAVVQRTAPTPL